MKTIEKGIPIPALSGGKKKRHPIHFMEIGDSFVTDHSGRLSAATTAKRVGRKITTRKQPDGTFRVWRTK